MIQLPRLKTWDSVLRSFASPDLASGVGLALGVRWGCGACCLEGRFDLLSGFRFPLPGFCSNVCGASRRRKSIAWGGGGTPETNAETSTATRNKKKITHATPDATVHVGRCTLSFHVAPPRMVGVHNFSINRLKLIAKYGCEYKVTGLRVKVVFCNKLRMVYREVVNPTIRLAWLGFTTSL